MAEKYNATEKMSVLFEMTVFTLWFETLTTQHTGRSCDLVFTLHLSANKDFEKLLYT